MLQLPSNKFLCRFARVDIINTVLKLMLAKSNIRATKTSTEIPIARIKCCDCYSVTTVVRKCEQFIPTVCLCKVESSVRFEPAQSHPHHPSLVDLSNYNKCPCLLTHRTLLIPVINLLSPSRELSPLYYAFLLLYFYSLFSYSYQVQFSLPENYECFSVLTTILL